MNEFDMLSSRLLRLRIYYSTRVKRLIMRWYRLLWDLPINWHPSHWEGMTEFYLNGKEVDGYGK